MKKNNAKITLKHLFQLLSLAVLAAGLPAALCAADGNPPERISYQGYLVDAAGNPLGSTNTGPKNYDVIFRIYNDQSLGSIVNRLWAEQQTVTVDKGYFSVMLGEGSQYPGEPRPLLSTIFTNVADASDRYVEITVKGIGTGGADSTIQPRMRLLSSPYAFLAKNAVNAAALANGAYGNVVTMTKTNVAINKSTASSALDVNGTITGTGLSVQGGATVTGATILGDLTVSNVTAGSITVSGAFAGYGTVPVGGIIMWSGADSAVPAGWALCNGGTVNGRTTPDLRGRFILGSGAGTGLSPRTAGTTGGEENHTLTTAEIPSHTHTATDSGHGHGVSDPGHKHAYTDPSNGSYQGLNHDSNGSAVEYPTGNGSWTTENKTGISIDQGKANITVGGTGGSTTHNNMPPYYVLAFIMRVQ